MRKKTPLDIETEILVASRRRCAICWALERDLGIKRGQIAHLDRDHANSSIKNLAFLCLIHHDEYDTKHSQSKGFTIGEVKSYRDDLHLVLKTQQQGLSYSLELTPSEPALKLIELLCKESTSGRKFDPQIMLSQLPMKLGLDELDAEEAVDEAVEAGLIEVNGTQEILFPLDRLFWSFDPQFFDYDPAEDAIVVAKYLMERRDRIKSERLLAELSWDVRRFNPAINFLVDNDLVKGRSWPGSAPFMYGDVASTVKTRRFLKTIRNSL